MKEFLDNVGGMDLGYEGRRYIWENKQEGMGSIKECLDRAVASDTWVEIHPDASVYTTFNWKFLSTTPFF